MRYIIMVWSLAKNFLSLGIPKKKKKLHGINEKNALWKVKMQTEKFFFYFFLVAQKITQLRP